LTVMRRIDELHLEHPFAGARMLRDVLRQDGFAIGRKRVATLMRTMGIEALYRRANTRQRHPEHRIYPYLLRGVAIERPNQVWAMDITYLPMARGFVYLTVVLDWATRRILAWRLSNSLTADAPVETLEEAITKYGTPEIISTDQGSQFTGGEFIGTLERHGIAISMDGKGLLARQRVRRAPAEDHQVQARLPVCVCSSQRGESYSELASYLDFYNGRRPHTALDRQTPDAAYFNWQPLAAAA